jgi:Cyclic nucleotide-binding domain
MVASGMARGSWSFACFLPSTGSVLTLLPGMTCGHDEPADGRATPGLGGGMPARDACGMQEIARFLAAHPPFDGLPPAALEQTAATVEIAYFPRGSSILRQSGEPSRYLHVIVKGVVELRQADDRGASELGETLAEGETFGQLSLLSQSPHLWDVVAREDVLAYLIPLPAGRTAATPARVRGTAGPSGR